METKVEGIMTQETPPKNKGNRDGWIIPRREKISYYVGAGSYYVVHTFVSTFLAAYLLLIGVSPAISATVLLFVRLWDSINDVLFGYFIDRVRFDQREWKRWGWLFDGRYLPWYRIAAFIFPIASITMFTVNTAAPLWLRVLQYVIGYILYDFAFTLATAPYGCMLTSMTDNAEERTFIQSYSILGQGIGALPVAFIGTVLVAGSVGFSGAAIVFAIYGFVLALPAMFMIKERNITEVVQDEEHYTLKEMFNFLKKSREFMLFELGQLAWGMFYTNGFFLFLAYYIFGDANISLIYLALGVIPTIAIIPFLPALFKRVNKMTAIRIVCVLYCVFSLIIYFMRPEGATAMPLLHYALAAVCGFSNAFVLISSTLVLPDIAEVAKYRTNTEHVGVIFSIHSFVTKLVSSLVTSLSLLILGIYGYVSVQADSFEELEALNAQGIGLQTEQALRGLWDVTFLFPAIGFGLAALIFALVKINTKDTDIMIKANLGEITREEAERLLAA